MLLITEETAKAMLEVQRADDIKDRASPEISLITRRQAPILAKSSAQHKKFITRNLKTNEARLGRIKRQERGLEGDDTTQGLLTLPGLYDSQEEVAFDL